MKTLRALALALDVRPGILADGIPPETGQRPLSRTRLERVARAAARGSGFADSREAALAGDLRRALSAKLGLDHHRCGALAGADRATFRLKTRESAETLASLVDRVGLELERE